MRFAAGYVSRAQLPASFSGIQRLGRAPRTIASIAQAARQRCIQQEKENGGPPSDPLMAEEGLAELRDQLKGALTYIEVLHTTPNLPVPGDHRADRGGPMP